MNFKAYFGANTGGADGIMFVLQDKSSLAIGQTGGHYLAYNGIAPSMGVEFDTFYYPPQVEDRKEIPQDHIAIVKDGNINNPISNRVPALASGLPIDDNNWHDIKITYDVNSHQVQVFFDTQLRLTQNVGTPVNTPTVYWGFTSSTGDLNNKQIVRLEESIQYGLPGDGEFSRYTDDWDDL